ncbi:VOC family protein [Candidatus Woesearchaeota archaeon]|nr:VOC family protein [Candidatus Woesearchaeota archaeon]
MKLNHVTLVVNNLEKSKLFYSKALGLIPGFEKEISGEQYSKVTGYDGLRLRFAVLKIPGSDVILELAQFINPPATINNDFRHIAFEVDDLDAVYRKLKSLGIETVSEPVLISGHGKGLDGKRFFYFKDPDRNLIELFEKNKNLYSSQ